MKSLKNLLVALAILTPMFVTAQKMTSPKAAILQVNNETPFEIQLLLSHCYLTGTSIAVNIREGYVSRSVKPTYAFLWEVDGVPQGHAPNIECVSGKVATVHVTQYPSGKRITKTVGLISGANNK